jgi:hypothetical protein
LNTGHSAHAQISLFLTPFFEMNVVAFLSLGQSFQIRKFKTFFFGKLEEEAFSLKAEKARLKKVEKLEKEVAIRVTLHSDLEYAKKDLVIAKLSLATLSCKILRNHFANHP